MVVDLLVKNGMVARRGGLARLDIGVRQGKVVALWQPGELVEAKAVLDVAGMIVLPGLIDPHVHAGHGDPDRENFRCASAAAAAGGITTIFDQPLSNPSTVTVSDLESKQQSAARQSVVDFALWGALIPDHLADIDAMFEHGATAFKAFMCRCSNYPMANDGTLLKGMQLVGELGGLVAVHAENDTLIQQLVDDLKALGRQDIDAFIESHPEYTELEAIERFIFLAKQVPNCRAHIVHMSIPSGALAIKLARAEGVANLSVETCPQYLGLCQDDLHEIGGVAKCDPPVRSRASVEKLWEYVLDGTIDIITSDHSPHTFSKKTPINGDFWTVAEGVSGLQTLLPVMVTEGRRRGLTWERLVQLCCSNPAKLFGLYGTKGDLDIGFDADMVVFDPERDWVLEAKDLLYLNQHSPFCGSRFHGRVEKTLVRGVVVYEDQRITAEPGFGRYYGTAAQYGAR